MTNRCLNPSKAVPLFMVLVLSTLACAQAGPVSQTQTSEGPRPGGRLNLRVLNEVQSFDPSTGAGRDASVANMAHARLLDYKAGPGVKWEELVLIPVLAERWSVSTDAKTYTFNLRKGLKFHDLPPVNGRELTSEDVRASYEYYARRGVYADKRYPASGLLYRLEGLDKIDTPDPHTVVATFKEPFAPFSNHAASYHMVILPKEMYGETGHPDDRIIGPGAFYLDTAASQKGTRYVWKKHAGYWEQGKPYLDEVYQVFLPEDATAFAAFQAKQIDMLTNGVSIRASEDIRKNNPQAEMLLHSSIKPEQFILNQRPGYPLADLRLRRAIDLALDRDEFIKVFSLGKGDWAVSGELPGMFSQEEVKKMVRHDPSEAARLVREAGYPNGLDLEVMYSLRDGEELASKIVLAQAQLKKAGINIVLKGVEHGDAGSRRRTGEFQSTVNQDTYEQDSDVFLSQKLIPGGRGNNSGVNDPALTEMVVAQRKEADPNKRQDIIKRAVRHLQDTMGWGPVLYIGRDAQFWHPYVKGYYPNWGHPGRTWTPPSENLWLEK